jgi:hypothetical protein
VILLWPIRKRIGALLRAVPRPYALLSVGSLAVLIGAQATGEGEAIYPLTDFGMYTVSLDTSARELLEYTAELSSGREERLLIPRMFPVAGGYLRRRIDDNVDALEHSRSGRSDPATARKLDTMLAEVARRYAELHPEDPPRVIRVWRSVLPLDARSGPERSSRELVYEYGVR